MTGRKLTQADKAIWQHVAKTVNSYRPRKVETKPAAKPASRSTSSPSAPVRLAGRRSAPQTPYTPAPSDLPLAADRRVRRGKVIVERKIDLHDMTQDQAFGALSDCITRAFARGQRCILVVTGKGRMGERVNISGTRGGGVLRRMLPLWLESPQLRPMIARIAPAHIKHGGTGAFYVFLKQRG